MWQYWREGAEIYTCLKAALTTEAATAKTFLLQPSLNKRRWICETGRSLARKESAQTCWVRSRKSSCASAPIFFKSRDFKSFLQPDFLCGLSCVAKKPSEYENILRIISRKFFFANIFLNILQHLPLLYILLWGRHQTQWCQYCSDFHLAQHMCHHGMPVNATEDHATCLYLSRSSDSAVVWTLPLRLTLLNDDRLLSQIGVGFSTAKNTFASASSDFFSDFLYSECSLRWQSTNFHLIFPAWAAENSTKNQEKNIWLWLLFILASKLKYKHFCS